VLVLARENKGAHNHCVQVKEEEKGIVRSPREKTVLQDDTRKFAHQGKPPSTWQERVVGRDILNRSAQENAGMSHRRRALHGECRVNAWGLNFRILTGEA